MGKPYEQMDDLGVPLFLETPITKMTSSLKNRMVGRLDLPLAKTYFQGLC